MNHSYYQRKLHIVLLTLVAAAVSSGCVHRRVTVRTEPPGAQVMMGERNMGITPTAFDVTWYGTEEITLMKDGYEIENRYIDIRQPWYQTPPLDFVTDNFLLTRVKDRHDFFFQLRRRDVARRNDLMKRGNELRSEAQIGQ